MELDLILSVLTEMTETLRTETTNLKEGLLVPYHISNIFVIKILLKIRILLNVKKIIV